MINPHELSKLFTVKKLDLSHAEEVLALCKENPQYYLYTDAKPTIEEVINDMTITPPDIDASKKYFVGLYRDSELIAVMDLIDGYPNEDIAYIGFFMMSKSHRGKGVGSAVIDETAAYLKSVGKKSVRLAIDKGNPQSTHFWKKNGFCVIKEVDRNGRTKLVAERTL